MPIAAKTIDSRAYVARFHFKGEDQQRKLKECSIGMRNRVLLAKMLREPANLIIMDGPAGDLDLDTLRPLVEAIAHYPGSMIIVTHDRYFLWPRRHPHPRARRRRQHRLPPRRLRVLQGLKERPPRNRRRRQKRPAPQVHAELSAVRATSKPHHSN